MKTVSLAYSTREINRNFRIKVSGVDGEGNKVHKLVGVSGAIALIGVEMFNKLLKRASAALKTNAYANSEEVSNFHSISNNREDRIMIARFHYNIPRHHGKYGTAVSVFNNREEMRNCEQPVAYYKTYKHQTPDEERVCDGDRQIEDLKAKVLKNFPNVEFINL